MNDAIVTDARISVKSTGDELVPPIETVIKSWTPTASLFGTKSERNKFWIIGIEGGAQYWIDEYLALRINRAYATNVMGYRRGGKIPFVDSGEMMTQVLSNVSVKGRMKRDVGPQAVIKPGAPREVNKYPGVIQGLQIIVPREISAIAKAMARTLAMAESGATRSTIQRGKTAGQARLSFKKEQALSDIARAINEQFNRSEGLKSRRQRGETIDRIRELVAGNN